MQAEDKLAFAFICILLLAMFLDGLGLLLYFLVFKGKVPVDPRSESEDSPREVEECPNGLFFNDDCKVCGGDPGNCPAFVLEVVTAEISKASIAAQRKDQTPEDLNPKEVGRASVQDAAAASEVCYTPRNLQIGP